MGHTLKYHIGVLLVLLFGGCANHPPKWFLNPQTSNNFFYGNGSSTDVAQAKNNAINDLAQNIQTQIMSDTHLNNTQRNNIDSSELHQNIYLNVASLELQNLKTTKQSYVGDTFYIQVQISKQDVLTPLTNRYNQNLQSLQAIDRSCKSLNLRDFATLQTKLSDMRQITQIINLISPSNTINNSTLQTFENLLVSNMPAPKIKISYNNIPQTEQDTLSSEIAKFFRITDEADIGIMENTLSIQEKNNAFEATLLTAIRDCHNNLLYQTSIKETQQSRENAIKRISIVLYKKLSEYQNSQTNTSIPKF